MKITITIKTDNDAFGPDDESKRDEVLRILLDWIENGKRGILAANLRDSNGNTVGKVTLTGQ